MKSVGIYCLMVAQVALAQSNMQGSMDNSQQPQQQQQQQQQPQQGGGSMEGQQQGQGQGQGQPMPTDTGSAPIPVASIDMGSDCRAPTIFNACMERGQQMLSKCSPGDGECSCRFSRAMGLCFEQCKTANQGQKQQIDATTNSFCNRLTSDQRMSISKKDFSASATASSSSDYEKPTPMSLTGKAAIAASSKRSSGSASSSFEMNDTSSDARPAKPVTPQHWAPLLLTLSLLSIPFYYL